MNKLKQLLPTAIMSLVGISSTLCAVDDMQMRNLENRVSALEQRRGANGMINPPTRPVVRQGLDLWSQLDVIYLHPTSDGLAYANTIAVNTKMNMATNQFQNFSYGWNFGWRLGLGYNLPHDGWDTLVSYTRFRSHRTESVEKGVNELYSVDIGNIDLTESALSSSTAKGYLKFDYLDWQFGREFFVSKWLMLRPFAGVRGFWLHRPIDVENAVLASETSPAYNESIHVATRYRAGGALVGLDSQWGLGMGWSVFSQADVALLYGKTRIHNVYSAQPSTEMTMQLKSVWSVMHSMCDLGLGLRWDRLLSNDNYRVRVQLGWEQHLLSNIAKDDLALSGVAVQARLDF